MPSTKKKPETEEPKPAAKKRASRAPKVIEPELTPEQKAIAGINAYVAAASEENKGEFLAQVTKIPEVDEMVSVAMAQAFDDERGFAAFYRVMHGMDIPSHANRWVKHLYGAKAEEWEGSVLFCWRGSWKSTTIGVTFTAYRIGKHPELTNMTIMANDDSADKVAGSIAKMIEDNPGWKKVFPNVVPDRERGWGAEGYWVKDTNKSKDEWAKQQSAVIDPTLIAGGYNSSRLIGKHPSGVLLIDDIHDEKNSDSDRARHRVVTVMAETLMQTVVRDAKGILKTWVIAIGTPWAEDDALHYLKNTGVFKFFSLPVMEPGVEGERDCYYVDGRNRDGVVFGDIVGWWKLNWPSKFNPKAIINARATSGLRGFARMFRMDLKAARVGGLKYYTYRHEDIDAMHWQTGGGVDYATVVKKGVKDDPGRDYFSMAMGAKTPYNKIVVFDGILEQCTQAAAEQYVNKPQTLYPQWKTTTVEGDGVGEQFVTLIMRNPGLKVQMKKTGGKNKLKRQEFELGPWLETGIVVISDADTPYLNELRKSLDDFPDGNLDIRDGLYWLCHTFPECLVLPKREEDKLPGVTRAKPAINPMWALARK